MVLAPSFATREKQGDLVSPGVLLRFSLRAGRLREAQQRGRDSRERILPRGQSLGHGPEAAEGPRVGEADQAHSNLRAPTRGPSQDDPLTYQAWHRFCHYDHRRRRKQQRQDKIQPVPPSAWPEAAPPTLGGTHACVLARPSYWGAEQKSPRVAESGHRAKTGAPSPRTAAWLAGGRGRRPLRSAAAASQRASWP